MLGDGHKGVLAACEDCHMFATGALDVSSLEDIAGVVRYLKRRIDNWDKSVGKYSEEYDPIVKKLAEVALRQAGEMMVKARHD